MANKLELTWYGKDEPIRIEPRLLIENAVLSNTAADPDTENMIIHGDNLLALKALERERKLYEESSFRRSNIGTAYSQSMFLANKISPSVFCATNAPHPKLL